MANSVVILHLECAVKPNVNIAQEREDLKKNLIEWLELSDSNRFARFLRLALCTNGHFILHDLPPQFHHVNFNLDQQTDELGHLLAIDKNQLQNAIKVEYYFYHLHDETMHNSLDNDDLPSTTTTHTLLPSKNLEGLWESLIFDSNIRLKLFNYVKLSIHFACAKVNPAVITWNKVILLHGPPGTGKTSLCKALSQKFAVRLYDRYENFQLIEINSHSLFSKWFSESGKLVLKLFDGIREFADDESNLIFVLIDEVESLAYDRQRNVGTGECTDALRVVNALLTQIDSIRKYPNVIILASSNVTDAMDNAFVDRADIKQYIGLPSECAAYKIYHHCVQELINSNIISHNNNGENEDAILSYYQLKQAQENNQEAPTVPPESLANSQTLLDIVKKSGKMSGRALRKLPFLAIALFSNFDIPIDLEQYLICLEKAVDKQLEDNKYFNV